jgi:hypothetical protein
MNITQVKKQKVILILIGCLYFQASCQIEQKVKIMKQENITTIDNSRKTVLARGCDPVLSLEFSKIVPPLIGNAKYIPTTNDQDFIEKLKSKKWSVVYFAPGACRYSAAKHPIPGNISETAGWTLDEYKELIYKYQGDSIQIVESLEESGNIELLNKALEKSREIN